MFGTLFSTIVFAVLGVMAGTSEYGSGTMRLTLAATPRRWRVLAAKAIVLAALALVVGLVADVAMFLVAQAVYASYGLRSASLADGDALRTVLCDGLLAPLLPLMALSLGIALRSTAGALTSVLAFVFAPWIVGGLLPDWWQDNVLGNLPGAAAEAITMGHLPVAESDMAPGLAAIVVAAWLTAFLGAACTVLERRDA
jgi:ABC-2 type transport system permease protein